MADELNIPTHRYYQPKNNILLAPTDMGKQYIYASGITKIDAYIASRDGPGCIGTGVWVDTANWADTAAWNDGV
jgi:hypothetical protein